MKVDVEKVKSFLIKLMLRDGADKYQSEIFINALIWSDQIGRPTHGLWRYPVYYKRFSLGLIKCPCRLEYEVVASAIGIVDGGHGFGHYVGHEATHQAMKLAKKFGVGVVGVRNSNHFGVGAYYVNQVAENDMIGIAVSNSTPRMAPHGGVKPVFGTNPFAFGAPRHSENSIIIDMATSASSGANIMRENNKLSEGIGIDSNGKPITDPKRINDGALLPMAGPKGYGLALMVEILGGVLTQAGISHGVKSMFKNFEDNSCTGHFFIAIDIEKMMPMSVYYDRIESLIATIKASSEGFSNKEVRIPGEKRWYSYQKSLKEGIELEQGTIEALESLGRSANAAVPW